MEEKDLRQVGDASELELVVQKIISANPEQVEQYKKGKTALMKFFIGLGMKETKGKADPEKLEKMLEAALH